MKENKMYKYLSQHNYISDKKQSGYQQELSEERAECIANKYNSLVEEKNSKLKEFMIIISVVLNVLLVAFVICVLNTPIVSKAITVSINTCDDYDQKINTYNEYKKVYDYVIVNK